MTIADVAQAVTRLQTPGHNVVTLDIERLPGSFTADFWDLNAFKGRRIHPDMVTEWPSTVCVAWKRYDSKRVEFASIWDDGHEGMLRKVWAVFEAAQVMYGHNVDRFDARKLNTEWRDMGLTAPAPVKYVDTLKEARKVFGDESFRLDALCERVGVVTKVDKYDPDVARAAVAGNKAAQKRLRTYNCGDVLASEALLDRLRGWLPAHPHNALGTVDDRPTCNQCWGDNLERNGTKLAQQITYVLYRCRDCGANVQGTRHARAAAITRGAR